jgi:hypothetical protein
VDGVFAHFAVKETVARKKAAEVAHRSGSFGGRAPRVKPTNSLVAIRQIFGGAQAPSRP